MVKQVLGERYRVLAAELEEELGEDAMEVGTLTHLAMPSIVVVHVGQTTFLVRPTGSETRSVRVQLHTRLSSLYADFSGS